MKNPPAKKNLNRLISACYIAVVLVIVILVFQFLLPLLANWLNYVPTLLMPLIVAIVLAAVMEPLVSRLERYTGRVWATILSFIIVLGGFILFLTMLTIVAIRQITDLYIFTMEHSDQIIALTMQSADQVKVFFLNLDVPLELRDMLEKGLTSGADFLKEVLSSMVLSLGSGLSSLPEAFMFIIIAALATFFVLKDQALIIGYLEKALPANVMDKATTITRRLFDTLVGLLRGYAILTTVTAVITIIGLTLMGIESSFMLGIIIAVLDIIPVIGSGIVFVPWMGVDLLTGQYLQAFELLALWVGVGIVRQLSEPKIVGDNIGLHPLVSLLSMYAGLKLGGFFGMILGPITVIIILSTIRAGLADPLLIWLKMKPPAAPATASEVDIPAAAGASAGVQEEVPDE